MRAEQAVHDRHPRAGARQLEACARRGARSRERGHRSCGGARPRRRAVRCSRAARSLSGSHSAGTVAATVQPQWQAQWQPQWHGADACLSGSPACRAPGWRTTTSRRPFPSTAAARRPTLPPRRSSVTRRSTPAWTCMVSSWGCGTAVVGLGAARRCCRRGCVWVVECGLGHHAFSRAGQGRVCLAARRGGAAAAWSVAGREGATRLLADAAPAAPHPRQRSGFSCGRCTPASGHTAT